MQKIIQEKHHFHKKKSDIFGNIAITNYCNTTRAPSLPINASVILTLAAVYLESEKQQSVQ